MYIVYEGERKGFMAKKELQSVGECGVSVTIEAHILWRIYP